MMVLEMEIEIELRDGEDESYNGCSPLCKRQSMRFSETALDSRISRTLTG